MTNLVEDLFRGVGQGNVLLEVVADFAELLALGPVVEGTGNVDLGGGMAPVHGREKSALCEGIASTDRGRSTGPCRI